jgi:hypothetical protein
MTDREIVEYYAKHKELYTHINGWRDLVQGYKDDLLSDSDVDTIIERSADTADEDDMLLALYNTGADGYGYLMDIDMDAVEALLMIRK